MITTEDNIPGLDEQQLVLERVIPQSEDTLSVITSLALRLTKLRAQYEEEAAALEQTGSLIKEIAQMRLPDLMNSVGLGELTLRDGTKIMKRPEYFANISKERAERAYAWLRERNMGGVIKTKYLVDKEQIEALKANNVPYTQEDSIHASTLKAFIKERIEADPQFPRELFGVHIQDQVVVK